MSLQAETAGAVPVTIRGEKHTILFTINALIELKHRGFNILDGQGFAKLLAADDPEVMRVFLWAGLRHEDPKRTEEEVGELITTADFFVIHRALFGALDEQSTPEGGGEGNPPVAGAPSHGSSSGPSPATTSDSPTTSSEG
jgi:hypothetical protein